MKKEFLFEVDELFNRIDEEMDRQDLNKYEDFIDADSSYISDKISIVADNEVDIYYSDLFEWGKWQCGLGR